MGGSESGKSFYRHSEQWYAKTVPLHDRALDQVMVEAGIVDALCVTWYDLRGIPSPKVHSFEIEYLDHPDFQAVLEVAAELAKTDKLGPDEFCARLLELGFENTAEGERPSDLDPRLERLRLAVQDVADIGGMSYQDEEWWPEVVALHRKLSPLPVRG